MAWQPALTLSFLTLILLGNVLGERRASPYDALASAKARQLSAATLRSKLRSRSSENSSHIFRNEATFDYMHDSDDAFEDSMLAATLVVQSREPILALEEIESYLKDITCTEQSITIAFDSIEQFNTVKEGFERASSFITVTSHKECNVNGERAVHR
jgi:hypothetical protein